MTTPQDLADRLEKARNDIADARKAGAHWELIGDLRINLDRALFNNLDTILHSLRRSSPASGEMGEAKFATQTYGAVVATIFEGNDVLVEVHKRQHSAELIIHNRRGETDRWDDCTADLRPEHFEMLGSVAKALRTPSGETGEEAGS